MDSRVDEQIPKELRMLQKAKEITEGHIREDLRKAGLELSMEEWTRVRYDPKRTTTGVAVTVTLAASGAQGTSEQEFLFKNTIRDTLLEEEVEKERELNK